MFYFHPYLGKIPIFTNIFSKGLKPPSGKFGVAIILKVGLTSRTLDDFPKGFQVPADSNFRFPSNWDLQKEISVT